MAIVTTDSANYTAIANAIRNKTGGADTYTPAQMAAAIAGIVSGGINLSSVEVYVADYSVAEDVLITAGAVDVYKRTLVS